MKLSSIFLRAALALALACSTALASAGPQYHVSVDTQSLAGQSGYLYFLFLGLVNAAPATATLSNFSGDFGAGVVTSGDAAGDVAGQLTLGNGSAWTEFAQWAHFGGLFGFDVAFEVASGSGAGTTLSVALLDADFGYLPATAGDVVTFALLPGQDAVVTADAGFAAVNEVTTVPEPSSAWLGAAGLLLMGGALRRRHP